MKKQEKRAFVCIAIATVLFIGMVVFTWRFITYGGEWATFYGNTQIFRDGMINRGRVVDRNGVVLLNCTPDGIFYNEDSEVRESTVHAVGDPKGNVSTGAINAFRSQLIGYDILNGTYDTSAKGKEIKLTIDSEANRAAYDALNGRTGTVGVFNWKTGEIVCMVSTPTFDPSDDLPKDRESSHYFNNFLSGALTPGSTFKLVTAAAVIDNMPDRESFSFTCDGENEFRGTKIRDVYSHGTVDFKGALAQSCNGAFGELTREVGSDVMSEYVEKTGLTEPVKVNGIETAKGHFKFPSDDDVMLSWAGIGQAEDQVNPCAMMVYMGAIANNGKAVQPSLIKNVTFVKNITGGKSLGEYLSADTAIELRSMMKNNVVENYGEKNFPGLDLYAKSGTAENGSGGSDSWFVGFIDNENSPYAFVVWVKNGGYGSSVAAPIARKTLNSLVE